MQSLFYSLAHFLFCLLFCPSSATMEAHTQSKPMIETLYLDCEFNSFGGELISLAIVPENKSRPSFYEVLDTSAMEINPWVAENVMPKLGKPGISLAAFQQKLQAYFDTFQGGVNILADWPEDIAWLCRVIITGPGTRIRYPIPFSMFCMPVDTTSANPHNALADAEAIRDHFSFKLPHPPCLP